MPQTRFLATRVSAVDGEPSAETSVRPRQFTDPPPPTQGTTPSLAIFAPCLVPNPLSHKDLPKRYEAPFTPPRAPKFIGQVPACTGPGGNPIGGQYTPTLRTAAGCSEPPRSQSDATARDACGFPGANMTSPHGVRNRYRRTHRAPESHGVPKSVPEVLESALLGDLAGSIHTQPRQLGRICARSRGSHITPTGSPPQENGL